NLNDGMAWGLLPLVFLGAGMSLTQIGILAALYPSVWGIFQLLTGYASDRIGRKGLIVSGMTLQAISIALIAVSNTFVGFASAAVGLGIGTAMVYPTLMAAIGDVVHPTWRASTVGVYRLWRDLGFAVGAILSGVMADQFGLVSALWVVAALTFVSGCIVWWRMLESHIVKNKKFTQ
ncbi:MAG: MFS transporter, partial [Undibacterium sp.]|nr:MFS transporter [Undibacterium sp.]